MLGWDRRGQIAEQANTLSALNRAKFDLGETIEGLKGAVRDAEDERRAAESEREWLAREVRPSACSPCFGRVRAMRRDATR